MNLKAIQSFFKKVFNWSLLKETFREWSSDKASRLAAALAYYAATALAPLVVGLLAIVGFVLSREQAQLQLVAQVRTYVGAQGAEIVETILNNADQPDLARLAGIFSLLALFWSASNIFAQLQDSLDTIWGVQLRPDLSLLRKAQHRLMPLLTILGSGLLLLVALVASTGLSAAGTFVSDLLPGGALLWQIVNFVFSLAIITLVFALIFKVLPDVKIAWSDVWPGAALTALLFMVGQYVLSWYLGRQSGASLYGAAGSLIILLLWLYYSAQIFLFGAEYTQVYATRYGHGVLPAHDAVARDSGTTPKPAAQAAASDPAHRQIQSTSIEAHRSPLLPPSSSASLNELSLSKLVVGVANDGSMLVRQEIHLMQAEISESIAQAARAIALLVGGGSLLYAGALLLLVATPIFLWSTTEMPLWFAFLLMGGFWLFAGWIITRWARQRLKKVSLIPNQTLEMLREDGKVVGERLAP